MQIKNISTINAIQSVYYPVLITLSKVPLNESRTLEISSGANTITIDVYFDADDVTIDISEMLKALFGKLYRKNNLVVSVDNYQSFTYKLSHNNVELGSFTAINAAPQIRETHRFDTIKGKLLTGFNTLYAYNNYPADASMLGNGTKWVYRPEISLPNGTTIPEISDYNVDKRISRLKYDCGNQYVKIDANITCTIEWSNFICQLITSISEIKKTNKTNGYFLCAALGQDNKLYFGSNVYGICYLDNDGTIKPTNKTDGTFAFAAIGQDGKLYFGSNGYGIWYLGNDGLIKQTNKPNGDFRCAATGQNGKLYFGGGSGIWYLDNDGTIKQTNKTDGAFVFAAIGQDGKLYFGGGYEIGIWYLDNDGTIKQTNKTDRTFAFAATGQDGKLYFGGGNGFGIWYLDNDGLIKPTNNTDGAFTFAAIGQDGKLYFGSGRGFGSGIWYLDNDGLIKPTNKTDGNFTCAAIGQDRQLYFGGGYGGIWYLGNDGQIKQTNKPNGDFRCAATGQNGKLYFGGYEIGIWYLEYQATENTGQALAKTATYKKYSNGVEVESITKSMLTDVNPALSEAQYKVMSDLGIDNRAQQLIASFSPCPDFEEINTVRKYDYGLCPLPFISINGKIGETVSFEGCELEATRITVDSSSPWTIQGTIPAWLNISPQAGIGGSTLIAINVPATNTDRQVSLIFINETGEQAVLNISQPACKQKYEWVLNSSGMTKVINQTASSNQHCDINWSNNEDPYLQAIPTPPPTQSDFDNNVKKEKWQWDFMITVYDNQTGHIDFEGLLSAEFYFDAVQTNII